VLPSDDAEAETFAGFLDEIEGEHLVEIFVVSEAGQRLVTVHRQTHDTGGLTQNFRRPLVCHFTPEILAVRLDTTKDVKNIF